MGEGRCAFAPDCNTTHLLQIVMLVGRAELLWESVIVCSNRQPAEDGSLDSALWLSALHLTCILPTLGEAR
jgi:hypothetical protein